jgi:hypothetical protein
MLKQYHNVFKKRIAQWLAGWDAMPKVCDSTPKSDTVCMSEKDFIV